MVLLMHESTSIIASLLKFLEIIDTLLVDLVIHHHLVVMVLLTWIVSLM